MTTPVRDVLIVGAGPAGSAAATIAARGGLDAVVIDKAEFPREKCCGDGLTTLALRLLDELGLESSSVASWHDVTDIHMRSPSGRHVVMSLPSGRGKYAAVTKRADLDTAMVELAATSGAEVREATGLDSVETHNEFISAITTNGEIIRARHLIAADGMWSPTRKLLGLSVDGYRGEWHAFRQYLHADGEGSRNLWVWFEDDLLPGYAWSFPLPGGLVNVGFGVVRGTTMSGAKLSAIWAELLDRPHIAEALGNTTPDGPHKAWPIPARIHDVALVGPRTMFVGDAAAATDPMTGEGIGQAIETGMLAAQAIADGPGDATSQITGRYQKRARAALVADHHMAAALSKVLSRRWAANASIRMVDTNDWTRRNFARWMFEDYPRAALVTPSRWRRGLFTSDGAYARPS